MPNAKKSRGKRDYLRVSQSDERPGVPHMRAVENPAELEDAPSKTYGARWQIFIPTLAILTLYSFAWLYLYANEQQGTSLARLLLIVLTIGVPLLAAHAFLRYQTIRVQVMSRGIRYHPGWPKDLPVDLPYDLIDRLRVKKSLVSALTRSGTLVIELTTGEKVAIADLNRPDAVRKAMESAIGRIPAI